MGETISPFVVFIGSLVIAALIVSVGFFIYNNQKETSNAVVEQTNRINNQLQEAEWTQYEAVEVTGSEVINVIKRMADSGTYVCVNGVYYGYTADLTKISSADQAKLIKENAKNRSADTYINNSTLYVGEVNRNETTGAILGITFTPAAAAGGAAGGGGGGGGEGG